MREGAAALKEERGVGEGAWAANMTCLGSQQKTNGGNKGPAGAELRIVWKERGSERERERDASTLISVGCNLLQEAGMPDWD